MKVTASNSQSGKYTSTRDDSGAYSVKIAFTTTIVLFAAAGPLLLVLGPYLYFMFGYMKIRGYIFILIFISIAIL